MSSFPAIPTASTSTDSLVDREPARAELERTLGAAAAGRGAAVLFDGPAGMGKTAVLDSAVEMARARGAIVARAAGSESETVLAWGAILQLGERLMAQLSRREAAAVVDGLLPAVQRLFGMAVGPAPDAAAADELSVVHGAFTVLSRLAEDHLLSLVVDDLHWADAQSLRLLLYLLQRLDELPVALVLARRPEEPGAGERRLTLISAHPEVTLHRLTPLQMGGVGELVRRELGPTAGNDVVEACLTATRGNPFYLRELLRELRDEQPEDGQLLAARALDTVPARVTRSVLVRVGRLGSDAVALTRGLAVLGDGGPLRRVAELLGLDPETAAVAADALARGEIIALGASVGFVHPLVRGVIEQDIPVAARSRLHLAAARLLDAEHEPAERVAAHLLAAAPTGDPWVVDQLRGAAEAALASGAPEAAARYLRRALAEPPTSTAARVDVLGALGHAEGALGDPRALEHLDAALATVEDPLHRCQLGLARGRALYLVGRHREAALAADAALCELPSAPDSPEAWELHDALQALYFGAAALHPEFQVEAIERSMRLIARPGAHRTAGQRSIAAQAAAQAALTVQGRERIRPLREQAWDGGRLLESEGSSGPSWTFLTASCIQSGDLEEAVALADAALADAGRRSDPMAFATGMYIRGSALLLRGEIAAARADLAAALDARRYGWAQFARATIAYQVVALIRAGEVDAAEGLLREGGDLDARDTDLEDAALLNARATLHLVRNRPEAALRDGEASLAAFGAMEWVGAPNRSVVPMAALALGRTDLATVAAERLLEIGTRGDVPFAHIAALRLLGLIEGGQPGLERLREAVTVGEREPPRLEALLARIDLGSALRRAGQRSEAREWLRRTADEALVAGALAEHARANVELAAAGARPRREMPRFGLAALTPSERRIAALAAEGMTNREIAQVLFVTPKTVEYHLRNTYSKLGIERRRELPGMLET